MIPTSRLTEQRRNEMYALMDRHYENVRRSTFLADLAEKPWVILLVDPVAGALRGFSTQMLLEVEIGGRPAKALFSGDTIVAQEHWGNPGLAAAFGRLSLELIDRCSGEDLYWFLISKGYKTYRFLPLFFRDFYPRHDAPTPSWARRLIDHFAVSKFPGAYDAAHGIVKAHAEKDRLRPGVADLGAERLIDPHVRYFAERNPGHSRGDELCCLAPLTRENFTRAAWRVIGPAPVAAEVCE